MMKKFNIIDSSSNEIVATVNSIEEATQTLQIISSQDEYKTFEIREYEYRMIKGLGRDPDLH